MTKCNTRKTVAWLFSSLRALQRLARRPCTYKDAGRQRKANTTRHQLRVDKRPRHRPSRRTTPPAHARRASIDRAYKCQQKCSLECVSTSLASPVSIVWPTGHVHAVRPCRRQLGVLHIEVPEKFEATAQCIRLSNNDIGIMMLHVAICSHGTF